jgi:hypothetical protein
MLSLHRHASRQVRAPEEDSLRVGWKKMIAFEKRMIIIVVVVLIIVSMVWQNRAIQKMGQKRE